jgi:TPR repeat protein
MKTDALLTQAQDQTVGLIIGIVLGLIFLFFVRPKGKSQSPKDVAFRCLAWGLILVIATETSRFWIKGDFVSFIDAILRISINAGFLWLIGYGFGWVKFYYLRKKGRQSASTLTSEEFSAASSSEEINMSLIDGGEQVKTIFHKNIYYFKIAILLAFLLFISFTVIWKNKINNDYHKSDNQELLNSDELDAYKKSGGYEFLVGMLSTETGFEEAAKSYREAADKGHADAQFELGKLYSQGLGVEKDVAECLRWYRKAADQGINRAKLFLGSMYAKGEGVEKDLAVALQWYRSAAEDLNTHTMFKDEEFEAQNLARCLLGEAYIAGEGVEKNELEGAKWFRKGAEDGYYHAQFELGRLYKEGIGVTKDDTESVKWIRKAADQGYASAQVELAKLYALGEVVMKDYIESYALFNIAGMKSEYARECRDELEKKMTADQIEAAQKRARELQAQIEAAKSK